MRISDWSSDLCASDLRDLYATAVLSGNRNFDGRIQPYAKQAFLASPPLVVAYAIAGTVRFDIEKDTLGLDKDGKPVTLKDIWPSDEEIDSVIKQSVKPEMFRKVYDPMFNFKIVDDNKAKPLYDWRPMSRSEEHTSELQSLMRISYAVFCLKKNKKKHQ